jgi:hypothetical protein
VRKNSFLNYKSAALPAELCQPFISANRLVERSRRLSKVYNTISAVLLNQISPTNTVDQSAASKRPGSLTEAALSDIRTALEMKKFMRTRTVAILAVTLAIVVSLLPRPIAAQESEVSESRAATTEFYGPPISPAIYLVNFLILYMVNPRHAANMPAFKAPIPKAVVACLEQNPNGCPYAAFAHLFEQQTSGNRRLGPNRCFWPVECQLERKFVRLAPHRARRAKQINKPLGMERAAELARALGMDESMILTEEQYRCLIGEPGMRTPDQQTFFRCIRQLTNSKGNAAIPLSSYGLYVNEQGDVRSVCAPDAPCLDVNALLVGPFEKIALQCGFLAKFLRLLNQTPLLRLIPGGFACQKSHEPACIIETNCVGK